MDPYKVLGVGYDASEDEIKSAYRKLSRMYHPDANVGKPNQKELEEKFKEVQQAYSMIMDQKQGKTTAQNGYGYSYGQASAGQGPFTEQDFWDAFFGGGFGNNYNRQQGQYRQETQEDAYLRSAVNYINGGYVREGLNVLEQIAPEHRHGKWYYISAVANYRVGNNAIALDHARSACALEPNNMQYRNFYNQLQGGGTRYQQRSTNYGGNPTTVNMGVCSQACCTLSAFSLCCGGGGFPIICCL